LQLWKEVKLTLMDILQSSAMMDTGDLTSFRDLFIHIKMDHSQNMLFTNDQEVTLESVSYLHHNYC
jgi:hypothetical protein